MTVLQFAGLGAPALVSHIPSSVITAAVAATVAAGLSGGLLAGAPGAGVAGLAWGAGAALAGGLVGTACPNANVASSKTHNKRYNFIYAPVRGAGTCRR